MSQENVEIAKRAMEAYNTRDLDYEVVTPDFEWTTAMAGVENEVVRGREGIDHYYASLDAAWESVRVFGGEFRDLGDRVLWLGQMEGRGRSSGVPVLSPAASLYEFREARFRASAASSITARRCERRPLRSRRCRRRTSACGSLSVSLKASSPGSLT